MKPFVSAWFRNWKYFVFSAVFGVSLFLAVYGLFNRIEAEAQLISTSMYKDAPSQAPWENPLQAAALAASTGDNAVRGELKDLSLWLKSYDFLKEFLAARCGKNAEPFCAVYGDNADVAPLKLMGAVSSQVDDGKILRIKAGARDAEQASALANALADQLVNQKRKLETAETERVKEILKAKKQEIESRLRDNLKSMAKFVGSEAGPSLRYDVEKPLGFLSDLQTKAADLELQISENERVMRMIRGQTAESGAGPSDYGPFLRIAELQNANKILEERKKTLAAQIQKSLSAQYLNSPAGEALNPIMEQYRADVENHAAVIKALTKAQLTVSTIEPPVTFFQKASPVLAHDRWSMVFMIALGLFLSQLIAIGGFLIARMWQDRPQPRSLHFHGDAPVPLSRSYGARAGAGEA